MLQAVLFVIILLIENQVMCMQKDRAQKRRDLKGRIMLIHIKNENETAAIDTLGAELVSFMGDDGFEHIWQGDKTYWGGHAPVLFPIVGALRDNRTCINGEWYEMKRHGVARHEEFTVTEQGEDYVTLQLTANEETKKQYPFDFVLTVSYYLTGSSITTKFTVKNADTKPMPFCIGGHPGFNIPIQSDEVFEDYDIVFEEKEEQKCPTLDMESCLIDFEKTNFELDDTDTIPLQPVLWGRARVREPQLHLRFAQKPPVRPRCDDGVFRLPDARYLVCRKRRPVCCAGAVDRLRHRRTGGRRV